VHAWVVIVEIQDDVSRGPLLFKSYVSSIRMFQNKQNKVCNDVHNLVSMSLSISS
jgi:hypothetical protein